MEMALILFNKLLSLFFIILLGFITVRSGLIKSSESRCLSLLLLYIIGPFAIMNSFKVTRTPEILKGLMLAVFFAALAHAIFIFLMRVLKKPLKLADIERGSVIYPNAGNLTIPLVNIMLGPQWVIYTCAYNFVEICLQWTHLRSMLSRENGADIKKILLNPNMISIFLGVIIFFTGLRFPGPIDSGIEAISAMLGPTAMFIAGMMLGGMSFKRMVSFRRVWLVVLLRLLAMPFIMATIAKLGLTSLVPEGQTVLLISLMAISGPSASTVMQMAQIFNDRDTAEYASVINVVSMLLCAVTMPLITAYYYL